MQFDQDSIREAMRLAQSPAGQQLLRLLQANGSQELRQAMDSAASGDYSAAKQAINTLLSNPEARALLGQMGGNNGSDGR